MSRLRANLITNQSADGAPTVQNGLVVTGVTTSTNVSVAQSVTATSFFGSGAGLIGVASTDNIVTGTAATFNTYPIDINAGMTVAGVASFSQVSIGGTFVLPTGNTAARTGVNTSTGDFRLNTQTDKIEYYSGSEWVNVGVSQPLINNITPTTFNGAAGTSITIIGNNFVSGANVHFVSSANGSVTAAGSVSYTHLTLPTNREV